MVTIFQVQEGGTRRLGDVGTGDGWLAFKQGVLALWEGKMGDIRIVSAEGDHGLGSGLGLGLRS